MASSSASFFIQEIGKTTNRKADLWNAVYLRGILRDGGRDEPFCLFVERFKATIRVDIDTWSQQEVDDLKDQIKDEVDQYAEFTTPMLHPTYFNRNQERRLLSICTTKLNRYHDVKDKLWVLNGKQRHVDFLEIKFKLEDQFLGQTDHVRLQSWVRLPRFKRGPRNEFFKSGRVNWRKDMFEGLESDDRVYRVGYVRCRFTSYQFFQKQPYKARIDTQQNRNFLSAASVMIDGRIQSFTTDEGSTDDNQVVRQLLKALSVCDVWVTLEDNYRTSHFLAHRAAQHNYAVGRMGGDDYWYDKDNDNLRYYVIKGVIIMNLMDALKKEYAANKMESHDLVAFMDNSYFAGEHKFGDEFSTFNAAHSTVMAPDEQATETAIEVRLVKHLAEHTMQLDNMAAVSNLCDLNIARCATGGQQDRVHRCLYRKCQERGFYIDHGFFKNHHVIEGSAAESTFRKIRQHWLRPLSEMDRDEFKAHEQRRKNAAKKKYIGGMVYPPVPGFKLFDYIFCCDFAALYPSIIMGYMLCYASIVFNNAYTSYQDMMDDPKLTVRMVKISGDCSVPVVVSYDGEPPRTVYNLMVEDLLNARRRYKKKKKEAAKAMAAAKEAGDEAEYRRQKLLWNIYEAAQLAAKVTANSAYGFLGTSDELEIFACNELSAVVTGHGRQMNMEVGEMFSREATPDLWSIPAKDLTEEQLLVIGFGARIHYGDTDSVMASFGASVVKYGLQKKGETMEEAVWRIAIYACACATRLFPEPNEVECEDAYMQMLLFRQVDANDPNKLNSGGIKKRYICYKSSAPLKPPSLKIQGYGEKRRDQPPITRELARAVIDTIWPMPRESCDPPNIEALETEIVPILHDYVCRIVRGDFTQADLTVTCKVKAKCEYKLANNVAVRMIEDHEKFDGYPPVPGSRIPFVYTIDPKGKKKAGGKKGSEKRATAYQLNPRFLSKMRMAVNRVKYLETMRNLVMPLIFSFPRARQTFDEILCRAVTICDGARRLKMQPRDYIAGKPKDRKTRRGGHLTPRVAKKPTWA